MKRGALLTVTAVLAVLVVAEGAALFWLSGREQDAVTNDWRDGAWADTGRLIERLPDPEDRAWQRHLLREALYGDPRCLHVGTPPGGRPFSEAGRRAFIEWQQDCVRTMLRHAGEIPADVETRFHENLWEILECESE